MRLKHDSRHSRVPNNATRHVGDDRPGGGAGSRRYAFDVVGQMMTVLVFLLAVLVGMCISNMGGR